VQCGVELPVSVAVEAVASLLAGGGIERCDAGEARELGVGAESADPGGLADQLSGDQSSAALQIEELRRIPCDAQRDLALELVGVDRQGATAGHEVPRDPHLDALRRSSEPPLDAIKPDLAIQGARRNAQFGIDGVKQPPRAILGLGALPHQALAVIDEQLDLTRLLVLKSDGQIRVTERPPGRSRARRCCRPSRTTARRAARPSSAWVEPEPPARRATTPPSSSELVAMTGTHVAVDVPATALVPEPH
jgi:hypothetical protein